MRRDRRAGLLGSASPLGLLAFGWRSGAGSAGHDPALDAVTAAVRSIVTLLHPYPCGVDLGEFWRATRRGGGLEGLAGYGEATVYGPEGSGRAELAAALALKQARTWALRSPESRW